MPITPVDPPANGDTAQRFFASLAPGAKPFEPGAPQPDYLEAPSGDQPPMTYFAQRIPILGVPATYSQKPDELDAVLMKTAEPELFQQQPEFAGSGPKPVLPGMDFWDSVKTGFNNESLAGLFLSHRRLKAEVMALPGELQPVPGYDALRDDRKRIADAGLEGELWSFRDSTSPNETTFRIWQFQQRQRDAQLAQRAGGVGMFLGSLLDPINLLPIGASGAATKGVWGTFWRGARAASINASQAFAQEGLKAEIDASYRNQGIMDALEIPAALGFAVGVIHARTAAHPHIFKPDQPPAGSAGLDPTDTRTVWKNGLRERQDFIDFQEKNKLAGKDGERLMVFHGTTKDFVRFSDDALGSNTGARSAQEGHFFASNPETSSSGYADFDPRQMTGFVRNSWLNRLMGGPMMVPYEDEFAKRFEGANLRPTYIRMENPYEVTDTIEKMVPLTASEALRGHVIKGEDGAAWMGVGAKDGVPAHFLELGKKEGEARTATDIVGIDPNGGMRSVDYTAAVKKAKALGHDGLIIRNTKDGGSELTDVYVVFDTKNIKNFDERWDTTPADILKTAPPHPLDANSGQPATTPVQDAPPPGPPRESRSFLDFIKGSKAVDESGQPIVVYHGTAGIFEKFSSALRGTASLSRDAKEGFFFSSSPRTADFYAGEAEGANVRPSYLRILNPLIVQDRNFKVYSAANLTPDDYVHDVMRQGKTNLWRDKDGVYWRYDADKQVFREHRFRHEPPLDRAPREVSELEALHPSDKPTEGFVLKAIAEAKAKGHDGVIIRDRIDGGTHASDHYVVFDESQIRNFDERFEAPPNPNLRADSKLDGMLARENYADRMTDAVQDLNRWRDALDKAEAGGHSKEALAELRAKFDAAQKHLDDVAGELDDNVGVKRDASSGAVIYDADRQLFTPGEGLKPTGTGIEKWGINPAIRMLNSMTYAARKYVAELVDLGGMKQLKNMGEYGSPTSVPLEAEIARNWKPKAIAALHDMQQAWLEARGVASESMSGVAWQGMKMQTRDWAMREAGLTWMEFDRRVAMAMRRGDADQIYDQYTPFVNKGAAAVRKFHEDLRVAGMDPNVDIFGKANRRLLEKLNKEVAALKAKGLDSAQAEARLQTAIDHINRTGTQSTALSYFTRYWNVDALIKGKDTFLAKVEAYFTRSGVDPAAAKKSALDVYKTLTRNEFRTIQAEADDIAEQAIDPMSAKMRSLQIPDIEIEEFLESSATLSVRHQLATFAPAIEMTRRFGDTSLKAQIDSIKAEYKAMHDAAAARGDAPLMTKIERESKQVEEDIKTLRDRLLNVAGASKDPHSWDQRTIRMLKHYMTWTTMGLSAFSQLGDLVRPAITEGLDAMHRYGFATLISDSRNTIFRMAQRERYLAGDSLEVVLASKAMAASDIGDVFASRSNFERKAGNFTNAFYMLNGMNHAVDMTKTWASVIVQSNINDAIYQWGMHMLDPAANKAPNPLMIERLKSLSIDGTDAMRIARELAGKGIQFKSVHLANTEAWVDEGARDLYRQALQRALQRTVVTPGLGDKPTWMSTPMGSLIGQFKSFGMSSTIRTLYAGLQDKDRNFFMGAAVLVGAGIVLNEIRSQLFSDRTSLNQPYLGILMDGVDRSGVLGSFTDINNAIEAASNNKIGARPLLGAGKKYPVTGDRLANAFFGPTAGKAVLAADTLGRIVNGDPAAKTLRQARQFGPLQNWVPVKLAETAIY